MVGVDDFNESIGADGLREGLGSSSLSMDRDFVRSCWTILAGKEGGGGAAAAGVEVCSSYMCC